MIGGKRLKNLEQDKKRAEWKADFWFRRWDDAQRVIGNAARRVQKAEADAALFKNDNEVLAEELDRLDADKTRLSDKLRQAKANAGEQASAADEWRELYWLAAERADEAEKIAEEMRRFADENKDRAEKAEAREEFWKRQHRKAEERAEARGYRFAVVYRARDGFTEHRRRIVIGPLASASSWSGEAHDEIERNRRPCERVHNVERMT